MIVFLILGVLLGIVLVIFVLQNTAIITVSFFAWQLEGSLALILMLAAIGGALVVTLMLLPEGIVNYFRYKKLLKENARVQEELRKEKERVAPAQPTLSENSNA